MLAYKIKLITIQQTSVELT